MFMLLLTGVLAAVCLSPSDPLEKNCMLADEMGKLARLKSASGRRIVFVGGSNLLYGLDSPRIERALGLSVCNMGLHAGLGLCFQMQAVLPYIREGDVVVCVPEYGNFGEGGGYGGIEVLIMMMNFRPEVWWEMDLRQRIHTMQYLPDYAAKKVLRVLTGCSCAARKYSDVCNEQGDLIDRHSDDARIPFANSGIKPASDVRMNVVKYLKDFEANLKSKGAALILMPPCRQDKSFDNQFEYECAIAKLLESNGLPFAVPPSRYRMDDRLFYDTPYHLNRKGRVLRTEMVIQDLKKEIFK